MIVNLTNVCCQNPIDLTDIRGVEIYLLESECRNENSYNEIKTEKERKAFSEKYKTTTDFPIDRCAYFIDIENCDIQKLPFLESNDIKSFDWKANKILLNDSGIAKLEKLEVPLRGLAFVLNINGNNIYGGWFWNKYSSHGCDRVWTWQNPREKSLNLKFGLGGFKCGTDPRTDEKLIRNAIVNGE